MPVDGNEVGIWDGIITIFSGYGVGAKIKRFLHNANGTPDDEFITLEDCRKMIGENEESITVIFDDWTHGEIYRYNHYANSGWEQCGETIGFI